MATHSPGEPDAESLPVGVRYRIDQLGAVPWPSPAQIASAHGADRLDRQWSCFDLSDCRHQVTIPTEVAGWAIDVCARYGRKSPSECTHPTGFECDAAGTLLRCRTCGLDGT
ncbi:hypothetical protein Q5424_01235 [Conexibacter sp. JD483]|uniref:hypothetical protein n=1 Tax=unclassified Conexibacter TaxID=2627773 RepID=UPI002722FD4F|nr:MULTISPECIES: hypothetical protein [unclassified Conexibacter]MDO8185852.1 hypothetical protein [Conexibacter sp. CPCC 205706]MDO8198596.1 hypothetical protein [Conexibacter sp. CPCC 205762]MDR9367682.1 hypothetical protein [Conexibacter sp. JD483]